MANATTTDELQTKKLAEAIASKGGRIQVSTGNLTDCVIKAGIMMANPAEELLQCVSRKCCHLVEKIAEADPEETRSVELCPVPPIMAMRDAQSYDRTDVKLTVKIFLQSWTPDHVEASVDAVLELLDTSHIDSLIVAFPPGDELSDDESEDELGAPKPVDVSVLHPVWKRMEHVHGKKKVHSLGVSDLTLGQLTSLFNWSKVKPSVLHFNIAACCTVPPELSEFAKARSIQILTHNDPADFIPRQRQRETFGTEVSCDWLTRETVFIKARSILLHKGYTMCLSTVD